ncbi:flagellar hook-associated protein FlgK [Asaia bogorensis]|uniref:flagellar hook-associated protein FlgK n=1 Tax=Asaia bogorensis TaxID=91915 RepID=UPI000EFA9143|nr:flagellar hook-associated protein FlgK [Asaia bogorensis]
MNLLASLSIATGSLSVIEAQYAVTANNVANANTTGYVKETAATLSSVAAGYGTGVRLGNTQLAINQALQSSLYQQNAQASSYTVMSDSLAAVSSVQGSTSQDSGSTSSLSDQLGNLQSALISLTSTPTQSVSQSAVVSKASALVTTVQTLASTYASQRQAAADGAVSDVSSINSDLTQIGALSKQIMKFKSLGQGTADLENQRLGVMSDLSSNLSVSFTTSANGDMTVRTADGTQLPTRPDQMGLDDSTQTLPSSTWPLSTSSVTLSSSSYYSAQNTNSSIPAITLAGQDITTSLTGGSLGGNLTLRDSTYPQMQAQLDSFSYTVMNRFGSAGLPLFVTGSDASATSSIQGSDLSKPVPQGIVGLSASLSVNSTYTKTPSALTTTTNSDGSTNTGVTTTISNVLSTTFGSDAEDVSGSLSAPSSNLGPGGSISTGYAGNQGLLALSTALTSNQGATIASMSAGVTSSSAVLTLLQTKVADVSGVNVNDEMAKTVALQNAYTANAKIISTVQTMFNALLSAIQ